MSHPVNATKTSTRVNNRSALGPLPTAPKPLCREIRPTMPDAPPDATPAAIDRHRHGNRNADERLFHALASSKELLCISDLETLLDKILQIAREILRFDNCLIRMVSEDGLHLIAVASFGYPQEAVNGETHIGQGIMGQAFERAVPIVLGDISRSMYYLAGIPDARSELAAPLIVEGRPIGVLNVESTMPEAFDAADVKGLVTVAEHASIAIHNARLLENLRDLTGRFERLSDFSRHVIDSANFGIVTIDPQFRITSWNAMMAKLFGPNEQQAGGRFLFDLLSGLERKDLEPRLHRVLTCRTVEKHQFTRPVANGRQQHFELQLTALKTIEEKGLVIFLEDVTQRVLTEEKLRENEKRLNHLAFHDSLTGLPNRLLFHSRLQQAMLLAQREKSQVGLLFLDLDRFKNVNDSLGHQTGDELLRKVAMRLRECTGQSDTIARLGGDEFVIIVQGPKGIRDLATVAKKILRHLPRPIQVEDETLYPAASIGIAMYPEDGNDVQELMKNADAALYRAKEQGRNTYQFYKQGMNARAYELLLLEGSLRHALEQQQFVLHYQPQINLRTRRVAGFEALLRWQHPRRGVIAPSDFIPLAEETGLIVPIGEWVLRTACRQGKAWQHMGLRPLRMAVNISPLQFREKHFVETVETILQETRLPPGCLELEITENLLMENAEGSVGMLQRLKELGLTLAIDDFGTGFSSLSYLQKFPIEKLKIDRSFLQHIGSSGSDSRLAAGIIALAQSMDLEVNAEGIENDAQLAFLLQRRCHQGQGYLFSRPLTAQKATAFLLQKRNAGPAPS
jgi:diguanylate cyclase (GGDEF)-like protein/PAS domain S-box-containing protein